MESLFSLLDNAENAKFFSFGDKPNGKKFSYLFSDIILNENEKSHEISEIGSGKINLIGVPNVSNDQVSDEPDKSKSNSQIEILYPNMFGKISEQNENLNFSLSSGTSIPNDKIETVDTKNKIKFEDSDKSKVKLETQPIFDFFTLSGFSVPKENEIKSFNAFAKGQKANIVGSNEQIKEIISELSKSPKASGHVIIENDNLIPEIEKLFGVEFPPEIKENLKEGGQLNLFFNSVIENDKKTLIVQIAPFQNTVESKETNKDVIANNKISQKSLFQKINPEANIDAKQVKYTGGNVKELADKNDVSLFKSQWGKQTFKQFSSIKEKTVEPVLNKVFANAAKEGSVNKTNNLFGIEDKVVKENFVSTGKLSQPNLNVKKDVAKPSAFKVSDSSNLEMKISEKKVQSENATKETTNSEIKGNAGAKIVIDKNLSNSTAKLGDQLASKDQARIEKLTDNNQSKAIGNDIPDNSVDKAKLVSDTEIKLGNKKLVSTEATGKLNLFQNKVESSIKNTQSNHVEVKAENPEIKNVQIDVIGNSKQSFENTAAKESTGIYSDSAESKVNTNQIEKPVLKTESGLKILLDAEFSEQPVKSTPAKVQTNEVQNFIKYESTNSEVETSLPKIINTGEQVAISEPGFEIKESTNQKQNNTEFAKTSNAGKEDFKANILSQKNDSVLNKVIELAENDKFDQIKIVLKDKVSNPNISDLAEKNPIVKSNQGSTTTEILSSSNSKNVFQTMKEFVSGYEQNLKSFIEDDFKADVEKNSNSLLAKLKGLESKSGNEFVKASGNFESKKILNFNFNTNEKSVFTKSENNSTNEIQSQLKPSIDSSNASEKPKLVNIISDNKNFVKSSVKEVNSKFEFDKPENLNTVKNDGSAKPENLTATEIKSSGKEVYIKFESNRPENSNIVKNDSSVKQELNIENEIKNSGKEVNPKLESNVLGNSNISKNNDSAKHEYHKENETENFGKDVHPKSEPKLHENSISVKSESYAKPEHQAKSASTPENTVEKNSSGNSVNHKFTIQHNKTEHQNTEFIHSNEQQNINKNVERLSQTVLRNPGFVNSEIKTEAKNYSKVDSEVKTSIASKSEVNEKVSAEESGNMKSGTDSADSHKDSQINSSIKSDSDISKDSSVKNEFINNFNKVNNTDRSNPQPKTHQVFTRPVPKEEIVKEIQTQLSSGKNQSIEIKLDPKELGHIKIQMDVIDKVLHAKVEVENEQVQHLLNNNIDLLKQNLIQNGLQLNSFNISLSNPNQNKYAGNSKKREQNNNAAGEAASGEDEKIKSSEKHYGYSTIEYVA